MSAAAVPGSNSPALATAAAVVQARVRRPTATQLILLALVLALVIRVALVLAMPLHLMYDTDARDYNRIAVSVAHGHGYPESKYSTIHGIGGAPSAARPPLYPHVIGGGPTAARPPLYPLLLAAVYRVSGDSVTAARLMQALLGVALVSLIGLCARLLMGRRAAIVALFIAAVYVPFIEIGTTLMSEALLLPLFAGLIAALIKAKRSERRARWAILCGALVGLATLTRANAIILILPALLVVVQRPLRPHWRVPVACVSACLILLVPWTVRNLVVMHHFVPLTTEMGPLLAGTYNPQAAHDQTNPYSWRPTIFVPTYQALLRRYPGLDETAVETKLLATSTSYIVHHPLQVPKTIAWNALRLADLQPSWTRLSGTLIDVPSGTLLLIARLMFYLALGLACIGVLIRRIRVSWFAWLPSVLLVLTILPLNSETRFRGPLDVLLVLLSAPVIASLLETTRKRLSRHLHEPAQRPGLAPAFRSENSTPS